MGTGGSFPGGKAWPGRDADYSPPFSAKVGVGAIPPPSSAFMEYSGTALAFYYMNRTRQILIMNTLTVVIVTKYFSQDILQQYATLFT
jgi:hypothetical protein